VRQTCRGEAPPSGEGALYSLEYQALQHARLRAERKRLGKAKRYDWWNSWFDSEALRDAVEGEG
jgi:hypothetical protein